MSEAAAHEQIQKVRHLRGRKWIKYPRAEQILSALEELLKTPKCHRMPNMLISGPTNNGKTMLVDRFRKSHRSELHLNGESSNVPVVYVQAPPAPDESRFYNAILSGLMVPFRPSSRVDQRQLDVVRALEMVGARMIIIDEIHHILAGPGSKQRQFLAMLKYLGNELMIPIVAVGTKDAFNALQADPQLANRFEPAILPHWKLDEDFIRLLASFESILPFECAGQLTLEPVATKIFALSEGTIGEMSDLLTRAARNAIQDNTWRIDVRCLESCGYASPSSKRRASQF